MTMTFLNDDFCGFVSLFLRFLHTIIVSRFLILISV